jgi:N-acetylmuramoyl-L-alanine amidase
MPGRDETLKLRQLEMLKITGIVGCLVECGFYTNDEDVRKMRETQVVPIAICNGIINWYNSITGNG